VLFAELPTSDHPLVILRPLVEADLPAWYGYLRLPEVFEHTSWNLKSADELAPYVDEPEPRTAASRLRLAIALRRTGQLVGTVGFHTVSAENRSAEIAYDLSPTVWGQGIATHVCRRVVRWAHASAAVLRVQATVLESNLRSAAVLERCGFAREGVLRSYRMVRGVPGDFHMYSHVVPLPHAVG
jgi:ribosomal-protein-alanine N-acetyltransferase